MIAKNTVEALQSGALYGFAGQVDGIVGRMIAELGLVPGQLNVIATGGLAPMVVEECAVFTDHAPWLTLLGLELVFERNSADPRGLGPRGSPADRTWPVPISEGRGPLGGR